MEDVRHRNQLRENEQEFHHQKVDQIFQEIDNILTSQAKNAYY
jgi:hypothetical protein